MNKIRDLTFTNHLFTKQKIFFHDHLAVLIGQHRSGKTETLNTLFEGLNAKHRDFFVNDQTVQPGDFQVIYLKDHFNLKDEIKLTKSSPFRNHILKTINHNFLTQEKYQKVTNEIQTLALAMESALNDVFATNLNALTNEEISLKFDVHKINLESIIDHLLEINLFDKKNETVLEDKNFNYFLARMLVFNVLRSATDETDEQRPIIVLFDNPELYTTLKTMQRMNMILRELLKKNNFYLILASNSVEYLTNIDCKLEHLNWLKKNSVYHFENNDSILQEAIGNYAFLLNTDYDHLPTYRQHFAQIFHHDDLVKEWNDFYKTNWTYFLKVFYVDHVFLKESTHNIFYLKSVLNTTGVDGCYELLLKNLIILATFFTHFGLEIKINPLSSLVQQIKMIQLFAKTN